MTINTHDTRSEYMRDLVDDGSGSTVDRATLQSRMESDFQQMGTLYTTAGSIPSTATVRAAGEFSDAYDAMNYLEIGGLTATTDAGDLVPIGFVYFYRFFDEGLDEYLYQVYIDEVTG